MKDQIILFAIPVFFLCIGIEIAIARRHGHSYRINDALTSLNLGTVSSVTGFFVVVFNVGIYQWVYEHFRLIEAPADRPWVWLVALIAYDFFYYWLHRFNHQVNVLWASHVVHHSSEDFNLTTALRQTATGFLFNWVFYLPLALFGVPVSMFLIIGAVDLLYQFWIHTIEIGGLGWFDRVFASPSNHRVHHGQNSYCIDRNYGGILIIWDRLFGSFVEEKPDQPLIYGIRGALSRWNPIIGSLHVYGELWRDMREASNWRDALRVWFGHPGWHPPGSKAAAKPAPDLANFRKFDVRPSRALQFYALAQYGLLVPLTIFFEAEFDAVAGSVASLLALAILLKSWIIGAILECDQNGIKYEIAWWLLATAGAGFLGPLPLVAAISCGVGSTLWLALMRNAEAVTAKAP